MKNYEHWYATALQHQIKWTFVMCTTTTYSLVIKASSKKLSSNPICNLNLNPLRNPSPNPSSCPSQSPSIKLRSNDPSRNPSKMPTWWQWKWFSGITCSSLSVGNPTGDNLFCWTGMCRKSSNPYQGVCIPKGKHLPGGNCVPTIGSQDQTGCNQLCWSGKCNTSNVKCVESHADSGSVWTTYYIVVSIGDDHASVLTGYYCSEPRWVWSLHVFSIGRQLVLYLLLN